MWNPDGELDPKEYRKELIQGLAMSEVTRALYGVKLENGKYSISDTKKFNELDKLAKDVILELVRVDTDTPKTSSKNTVTPNVRRMLDNLYQKLDADKANEKPRKYT